MGFQMEILDKRMEFFKERLRNSGVKLTHQRVEIFREVAISEEHPDAEKIYSRVRKRLPSISLDTVYRTLWSLLDLGLISTLGPPRKTVRFDANMNLHHHFVCTKCGMTRDFYSKKLDRLRIPESESILETVQRTQVEVKGICLKCSRKMQLKNQPSREEKRPRN
jgi:Fur family transcriptional regulator, peroxide stress response regulator